MEGQCREKGHQQYDWDAGNCQLKLSNQCNASFYYMHPPCLFLPHPITPYHVVTFMCNDRISSKHQYRSDSIVPQRMKEIEEAIQKRDFQTFGRITMQVSICLIISIRSFVVTPFYLNSHFSVNFTG